MRLYVLMVLLLSGCTVVSPGERGVRYTMGSMSNETVESGTHLWIPYFAGMSTMDVKIYQLEAQTSSGTKDQQEVSTTVTVNLQIDPSRVIEIVKATGFEKDVNKQILPLIQEAINANVSKYSAEEVLTRRGELKLAIESLIKERVGKYGVLVHDVSIKDLQYSKEYADAVERKQVAEQKAKQAEYDAQRAIKEADAEYNRAVGPAKAQNLIKTSTTPELLKLKYLEKWDGKLPSVMTGGNTSLMMNLDSK